ncbi:sigma 54-interacting transcriptional regulator [Proteiniborus sp. MB09-C3]|uniref:sigma-54-dependent Fis family transcriptional regulator n=1 Tax=Proteiniborus sp. MB09-C3 TaxID=3050072 RepID=UPI0025524463|nr:sigma 54-interacting transcriptional regulator [Proteiniborus sp. MB09-C3]WIV11617.1 sigma 54-interacting transcriptional regulator [Proteiniborus sp. MB09-C3]
MGDEKTGIQEYYELSQKVAEAIEAVLGIDVTIMNESMERVAGTGIYKTLVNDQIEKNSAFDRCLSTGKSQVITDRCPESSLCCGCSRILTCVEHAAICVPIRQGEKVIGVLGIIAFNEEQKKQIIKNADIYLNYLEKMALLLEGKYSEFQVNMEKKILSDRMKGILDTINSGVVIYDGKGKVLYKNNSLVRILNEMGIEDIDCFVKEIRKNQLLQSLLDNDECTRPCEIAIDILGVKYSLLVTITCLNTDSLSNEVMLTIQNINYFKKQVMQSIEKNQLRLQFDNILGISDGILEVKKLAEKAALSDSNVLILGESGTGKELFARAIHNCSDRKEHAFVPINCGAIPDELFESELFGYEKGAFTGAYANKIGKFEIADKGTVFLDEISEMPYRLQVKLLRILQEKEVSRIGSNKIQKIDIKIIAATNVDLQKRVREGLFREDLYYRLNVIPINIPPLRKRKEDIVFITNHFIKYYAEILKKDMRCISNEAMSLLLKYPWPGNVRELQNLIEYAVNFETGKMIRSELIEKRLLSNQDKSNLSDRFDGKSLGASIKELEKELISNCINKYSFFNSRDYMVQQVCNELEIGRATFYRKIKELDICLNNETCLNNENRELDV